MRLEIYKDNSLVDITQFCSNFVFSGDIETSSRILNFNLFEEKLYFDIELGNTVLFVDNDLNVWFKGYIMKKPITEELNYSVTAYDSMFWMANNKDTFVLENKTIGEVMREIGNRFQLRISILSDSSYKIKSLPIEDMTAYDYFRKAEEATYSNTGEHFFLRTNIDGIIELGKRTDKVHNFLISKGNLISYSYDEDATNIKTKVKLSRNKDKNTIIATSQSSDGWIQKFGILQDTINVSEDITQSQLNLRAEQELSNRSGIEKKLTIDCLGVNGVFAGDIVLLSIPEINIEGSYYVNKDTHNYSNNTHTMSLELKIV